MNTGAETRSSFVNTASAIFDSAIPAFIATAFIVAPALNIIGVEYNFDETEAAEGEVPSSV